MVNIDKHILQGRYPEMWEETPSQEQANKLQQATMSPPKKVQLFIINLKFLSRRKVELLVLKGFFRKSQLWKCSNG